MRNKLNYIGYAWLALAGVVFIFMVLATFFPQVEAFKYLFLGTGVLLMLSAVLMLPLCAASCGLGEARTGQTGEAEEEEPPAWLSWLALSVLSGMAGLCGAIRYEPRGTAYAFLVFAGGTLIGVLIVALFGYALPAIISFLAASDRRQQVLDRARSIGLTLGYLLFFVWMLWLAKGTQGALDMVKQKGGQRGC